MDNTKIESKLDRISDKQDEILSKFKIIEDKFLLMDHQLKDTLLNLAKTNEKISKIENVLIAHKIILWIIWFFIFILFANIKL